MAAFVADGGERPDGAVEVCLCLFRRNLHIAGARVRGCPTLDIRQACADSVNDHALDHDGADRGARVTVLPHPPAWIQRIAAALYGTPSPRSSRSRRRRTVGPRAGRATDPTTPSARAGPWCAGHAPTAPDQLSPGCAFRLGVYFPK